MLAGSMGLLPSASLGAQARGGTVRAHPRVGARHRRPRHRESLCRHIERRAAAAICARARDGGARSGSGGLDAPSTAAPCPRISRLPARPRLRRVPPAMRCWLRYSGALEARREIGDEILPHPRSPPIPATGPSPMPARGARASSMPACVMLEGCAIKLSTPPSDSASVKQSSPSRNAATAASPPASSKLSMAPKPVCWRRASAWPGMIGESRVVHARYRRMALQAARRRRPCSRA